MIVDLEYTFVGCNRCVNALDWGQTGLIAFTAHNAIVIADVKVISSQQTGSKLTRICC